MSEISNRLNSALGIVQSAKAKLDSYVRQGNPGGRQPALGTPAVPTPGITPTTPVIGASLVNTPGNTQASPFTPIPYDTFSEDRPGYHEYSTDSNLLCTSEQGCTQEEMIDYLHRHAYPGQDPNNPVGDGEINPVRDPRPFGGFKPGGDVVTWVSPDGMTIVNRTQEGHVFHDGIITRKLEQVDGDWYITTSGIGNNENLEILGFEIYSEDEMAEINKEEGVKLFNHIDEGLAEAIASDHPPQPGTDPEPDPDPQPQPNPQPDVTDPSPTENDDDDDNIVVGPTTQSMPEDDDEDDDHVETTSPPIDDEDDEPTPEPEDDEDDEPAPNPRDEDIPDPDEDDEPTPEPEEDEEDEPAPEPEEDEDDEDEGDDHVETTSTPTDDEEDEPDEEETDDEDEDEGDDHVETTSTPTDDEEDEEEEDDDDDVTFA